MNNKSIAVAAVAVVAAMLVASIAGTNTVYAGGYEKNQATSQANACGNGELPLNVACQNINSQIQGDENAISQAADQWFN